MTPVTQKVSESIESTNIYSCEICNYITDVKSNYKKHCMTARHINMAIVTGGDGKVSKSIVQYSCSKCDKTYKSRNGLWCHSKKCSMDIPIIENPNNIQIIDAAMIMELIKQNRDLQNVLIHQSELINKLSEREPVSNTINGNITNNNNQKFNLNFFLNETCKDAMNIQDFLENIHITFEDLLTIGNSGFVNGVSDILIKQLRDLDISKRPIHCTDAKRETFYLKEEAAWNKDDKDKSKLKNIIEKLEYKNVAALRNWCNENSDAKINNTPNNLLKDKIYYQTLQGDERTREKIIKNISKEVFVEKE